MRVGIIDYGVGNLGSVVNALRQIRVAPVLLSKPTQLDSVDCLILPGVGSFADCAHLLDAGGWVAPLKDQVMGSCQSLIGICVGMQLLADRGYEGARDDLGVAGLGLISGKVEYLKSLGCKLRIPHVGWNEVIYTDKDSSLFVDIPNYTDFYFVHSYAFQPKNTDSILAITNYDVPIAAVVKFGNAWGTQFHPEKSSRAGFQILRNFIDYVAC
jgi:glutamine amidotransferase